MAYATYEEAASAFGEDRLRRIFPDSTKEYVQSYIQRRLEAAAGSIDSYLAKVYETPVDVSLPPESDSEYPRRVRLASMLSDLNICLTLYNLGTGTKGMPEHIADHFHDCIAFLKKLAEGEVILPGAVKQKESFRIVGDATPLIKTEMWETNRVVWGD